MAGDTKILLSGMNATPATELFSDMWRAEQAAAQQRMDPLQMCGIPVVMTDHQKTHFNRERGTMVMQAKEIMGDRRFSATGVESEQVTATWRVWDLDAQIKDGEDGQTIWLSVQRIVRQLWAAKERAKFSIVANVIGKVPGTDSATDKADGVAFSIASNYKAVYPANNPRAREVKADGAAVGWNMAKLMRAKRLMQHHHMLAEQVPVILTTHSALYGFNQDEDSANRDYSQNFDSGMQSFGVGAGINQMWNGFCWAAVGEFPSDTLNVDDDDKIDGIKSANATVNSESVSLQNNYCFSPGTVVVIMPSGAAGWDAESIKIYEDPDTHALKFRMSLYMGAVILNPKFIGRIINKSELG